MSDNIYHQIENRLYQGGMPNGRIPSHIKYMMTLCNEMPNQVCVIDLEMYSWNPIDDGPNPGLDWLEDTVDIAQIMFNKGEKFGNSLYIHCRAGVSRSTMVTAGLLMKKHFWTRDVALEFIASENRYIDPAPAFMRLLKEYENNMRKIG